MVITNIIILFLNIKNIRHIFYDFIAGGTYRPNTSPVSFIVPNIRKSVMYATVGIKSHGSDQRILRRRTDKSGARIIIRPDRPERTNLAMHAGITPAPTDIRRGHVRSSAAMRTGAGSWHAKSTPGSRCGHQSLFSVCDRANAPASRRGIRRAWQAIRLLRTTAA